MDKDKLISILDELVQIESDPSVPRNVRARVKSAIMALEGEDKQVEVKIDRALEELGEADNDPNMQQYTRAKIWNVVSSLEGK